MTRTDPAIGPPLSSDLIDDAFARCIDAYRQAKRAAAEERSKRGHVERAGHYDKDTPLSQRTAVEGEAAIAERLAAFALADEALAWTARIAAR